jgi:hypothetical protein
MYIDVHMRPEISEELVDRVIEKWKQENKIAIDVPKSKVIEEILLKYIESTSKIKTSNDKRDKLLRRFMQVGRIIKKPKHQTNSVLISSTKFGSITIGNKKYENDVFVSYKDTVKEGETASRHLISKKELALLLGDKPDVIVLGTGQEGCMRISSDSSELAKNKGIEIVESKTPDAIKKFNQLYASGRKVVGYMHVTC